MQVVNSCDIIHVKFNLLVISYYKHLNLCLLELHTVKATVNYCFNVSELVGTLAVIPSVIESWRKSINTMLIANILNSSQTTNQPL